MLGVLFLDTWWYLCRTWQLELNACSRPVSIFTRSKGQQHIIHTPTHKTYPLLIEADSLRATRQSQSPFGLCGNISTIERDRIDWRDRIG